jgi:hypothetical protein
LPDLSRAATQDPNLRTAARSKPSRFKSREEMEEEEMQTMRPFKARRLKCACAKQLHPTLTWLHILSHAALHAHVAIFLKLRPLHHCACTALKIGLASVVSLGGTNLLLTPCRGVMRSPAVVQSMGQVGVPRLDKKQATQPEPFQFKVDARAQAKAPVEEAKVPPAAAPKVCTLPWLDTGSIPEGARWGWLLLA